MIVSEFRFRFPSSRALPFPWIGFLLLSAIAVSGEASALTCDPPAAGDKKTLVIDARTVRAGIPRREFKLSDEVQLSVVNKNPFRYTYTLATEEKLVQEPAIDEFLKLPIFGSVVQSTSDQVADTQPVGPSQRPLDLRSCSGAWQQRFQDLQSAKDEHEADVGTARVVANQLSQSLNPLKAKVTQVQTQLADPNASCADLSGHIAQMQADLAATPQLKQGIADLKTKTQDANLAHAALQKKQREFTSALAGDRSVQDSCRDQLATGLQGVENSRAAFQQLYDSVKKTEAAHEKTIKAMESALGDVRKAAKRPDAFVGTITLGPYSAATDVTITLKRKDTSQSDATDEQVAAMLANFGGGPKFSIGIGLGFSSLERIEFQREQSVDATSGAVNNIVGLKEDSDYRIVPMIFLHGKVSDNWSVTAGVGPHSDDQGTEIDSFLGASYTFAERGRISAGAYFGKVQELGGGFSVGDTVPDEIAEIPIRMSNEVGVGVFFSWTIAN